MGIAFFPVSIGGAGYSELTRLYFIYSGSFVVPKVSLHLHLLTGGHFSATQAGGASVRVPVPFFEQHKHPVHLLRLSHSALLESSRSLSLSLFLSLFVYLFLMKESSFFSLRCMESSTKLLHLEVSIQPIIIIASVNYEKNRSRLRKMRTSLQYRSVSFCWLIAY